MELKQETLKPQDVVVAVALAILGDAPAVKTYSRIADTLGMSSSTTHESVSRLQQAGLLLPGSRTPNLHELRNFLAHGVRVAFPPVVGRTVRGVPTAHAGPTLHARIDSATAYVWPDPKGDAKGTALAPLYPRATELRANAPEVYDALTLIDALRVGQVRERNAALAALDERLGV